MDVVIFNRCDDDTPKGRFRRTVKALNRRAQIVYERKDGTIDDQDMEELPFDLDAEVIELSDADYGIWYLDSLDHLERYEGKKVSFVAMVLKPGEFPKGYFVPGRMAMTCCAEDMAFLGFACEYDRTDQLKEKQWVKVTAEVAKEYFADYQGEGPVLHAVSVEQAKAPREEIISFT